MYGLASETDLTAEMTVDLAGDTYEFGGDDPAANVVVPAEMAAGYGHLQHSKANQDVTSNAYQALSVTSPNIEMPTADRYDFGDDELTEPPTQVYSLENEPGLATDMTPDLARNSYDFGDEGPPVEEVATSGYRHLQHDELNRVARANTLPVKGARIKGRSVLKRQAAKTNSGR